MKNRKRLLRLSIIFLMLITQPLISISCGLTKTIIKTEVVYIKPKYCPKPTRPKYKKLDENQLLTSSYNVNSLLYNIISLKTYSEQLENVIKCYEKQINIKLNKKIDKSVK